MSNLSNSIRVEHLTRIYPGKQPVIANDDLTFEVKQGEIFGLLGPNGAGKTTLVYQILGLTLPTSGTIWLEGIDVAKHSKEIKRITGFLPQTGLPMRYVEVERALHYTGRLRGQNDADAKQQTRQLIEELGIGEYAKRYVHKLSGGILRLTNFAMALMGSPKVVVLDEPTNELDPQKRRIVWDMIARLNRERGMTCVLVTHNVLEAERVIQRVAVMQHGKIVAFGTPGELKLYSGGKVRLDFRLKDGESLNDNEFERMRALGEVVSKRAGDFSVQLPSNQVAAATDLMMTQIGMARLDDFRLSPPSLEDVYLEFK
ncbi:MAG: ABC transporter ATP-binding protein [Chloroflexota bacterium]